MTGRGAALAAPARPARAALAATPTLALAAFASLLMLAVALPIVMGGPLPPGDGGLFYVIVRRLMERPGDRSPLAWSGTELPLGYPPLGFYLAAALARLGMAPEEAMRTVALGGTVLAAGAGALALWRLASAPQAAWVAALLMIGLPRFWAGQLAGGGVTRAPGLFFCVLAWLAALGPARLRTRAVLAGALAGVAMLFHPEMGLYGAAGALFLMAARAEKGTRLGALGCGLLVCLVAALVSSPWWASVAVRYGVGTLLGAAAGSQGGAELRLLVPLLPPVYGEAAPWPVAAVAMAGTVAIAARGKWLPLLMAAWLVMVDPRKGTVVAALPLALGGGEALWALARPLATRWKGAAAALAVGACALVIWTAARAHASPSWPLVKVSTAELAAMEEVERSLPPGGRVLVLAGGPWVRDPWSDWGPALTGREFVLTVQGSEWLGPQEFGARRERYRAVQECAAAGDVGCIEGWLRELRPDAVWVTRGCPCHEVEERLQQMGAAPLSGGLYLLGEGVSDNLR